MSELSCRYREAKDMKLVRTSYLYEMDFIIVIIAVRAVVEESCLVALITLVHGFVHLAAGRVVVLDREGLARHQVPDCGELAARQRPESHEDFCLRGDPGPVHLPVQRSARVRRVDVEGLEGQSILGDVLDDIGGPYSKPRSGQMKSLPLRMAVSCLTKQIIVDMINVGYPTFA